MCCVDYDQRSDVSLLKLLCCHVNPQRHTILQYLLQYLHFYSILLELLENVINNKTKMCVFLFTIFSITPFSNGYILK